MRAHELLGVEPDAGDQEIRAAYRKRVKEVHPDLGGDTHRFIAVRQAREELLARLGRRTPAAGLPPAAHGPSEPVNARWPVLLRPSIPRLGALGSLRMLLDRQTGNHDLWGAALFTAFCAAVVATRMDAAGCFGILANLVGTAFSLCLPAFIAALAGASDARHARGIYTGIVFTMTLAMYFGVVGSASVLGGLPSGP